jgi:hypothetical protein
MAQDELLKRIDRHMERGNALAEEHSRVVEENSRVIEESMRETREFMRELLERNEWFSQQIVAVLKDLQDQTKAQTQAILRVLDRLQPS